MKRNPWIIALAVLLAAVALFGWWQHRQLRDLQLQIGMRLMDDYHILNRTVRELRMTCGQSLVSGKIDRDWLRRIPVRHAAKGADYLWRHEAMIPLYNYVFFFLYDVEGSLDLISREQPMSEGGKNQLATLHEKLLEMEAALSTDLLSGEVGKVAHSFVRGRDWPEICIEINEMVEGSGYIREFLYTGSSLPEDPPPRWALEGDKFSPDEALKWAREFMGLSEDGYVWEQTGEGWGNDIGTFWSFTANPRETPGHSWTVEITETGGYVTSVYREPYPLRPLNKTGYRTLPEPVISAAEAANRARSFMTERGFNNLQALYMPGYGLARFTDEEEGVYQVELLHQEGDVYYQERYALVEVDGATGEIAGLVLQVYYSGETEPPPEPVLSREEARDRVNPRYSPEGGYLVYSVYSGKLFYLFRVAEGEAAYVVYINAVNGDNEGVYTLEPDFLG